MKPAPFDYLAPSTVDEALAALVDTEREVKVLAGGQSLVPVLNMRMARPEALVDITGVAGLDRLEIDPTGDLVIGAAVRQARVAACPQVRSRWPLLARAIEHIGHPQIRNRGTVCGSLAHHDPAAELPCVAVALGMTLEITGPAGRRSVPAAEFFTGPFQTAVEPDELLVAARVPAQPPGWAFAELARRRGDFATVGAAAVAIPPAPVSGAEASPGRAGIRVVLCGVGPIPSTLSLPELAAVLGATGAAPAGLFAEAAGRACAGLDPTGDVHAGSDYRREAARVLVECVLTETWERHHAS